MPYAAKKKGPLKFSKLESGLSVAPVNKPASCHIRVAVVFRDVTWLVLGSAVTSRILEHSW